MKSRLIISLVLMLLFASKALASDRGIHYATVIDATPVVKTVRVTIPRQECWQEEVAYGHLYDDQYHRNGGGALLGGVIGGAIGHAVGHRKRNKQVGSLVGAVLGATIGSSYSSSGNRIRSSAYGTQERCELIEDTHFEERIVGYDVRYRYSNVTYSTRTDVDPGDTIRVRVVITPIL